MTEDVLPVKIPELPKPVSHNVAEPQVVTGVIWISRYGIYCCSQNGLSHIFYDLYDEYQHVLRF